MTLQVCSYFFLPVSPQLLHHVLHFLAPLCRPLLSGSFRCKFSDVHLRKLLQREGPAVEAGAESNCSDNGVNLTKIFTINF